MKRNLFINIYVAAGLLAGICSCSKDNEMEEYASSLNAITTKAEIREILNIETETAGTVAEKIGAESTTVQKLVITGPINAADVDTIRKLPQLVALDLKGATLCSSDETYSVKVSNSTTYECQLYDNEVGEHMFRRTNLGEIILPDNLVAIGGHAFTGLRGTTDFPFQTIDIPEGVTRMGEYVFEECRNLESVTFPSTLKILGNQTFRYCTNLRSVELGGIEEIGEGAFYYCSELQNIELSENVKKLGYLCFRSSGLTSITIPESVTSFGDANSDDYGSTFYECNSLRTAVLPENMTEIPNSMFYSCDKLTSVNIPQGVTHIRVYAFKECESLPEITLPEGLVDIGNEAFRHCKQLNNITLPETLTGIGGQSFGGCTSLTSITIPNSTDHIGTYCFDGCTALESVTLSNTLTELGEHTFQNCESLESITLPNTITSIGESCFAGCTLLSQITLPNQLEIIESNAFRNCPSLKEIELPDNLKEIEQFGFSQTGIIRITLPDGLETIGVEAFSYCENLTTINIPKSVTFVGNYQFCYSYRLSSIFWNTTASIPNDLFGNNLSNGDGNPNCLLYLADASTQVEDTKITNIIINGVADEIVLSSEQGDFHVPQEFKANRITYTRNFSYPTIPGQAAGWRSISLPFTVESITGPEGQTLAPFNADVAGAKPFWLRRLTENGFENVTKIEANVPYIIAMPNNEAYDAEYNISGTVTFKAESGAGITIPATDDIEMTQDVGPAFALNCNFSYYPSTTPIYVLNEEATDSRPAGSVFIRNERDIMPFEGYVGSNMMPANAPAFFSLDAGRPATRSAKPLGPVPSIDDM